MPRQVRVLALCLILTLCGLAQDHKDLFQDRAGLLDASVDAPIVRALQQKALEEHQVPIAVVTEERIPKGASIEAFADALYTDHDLGPRGMLILVGRDDRKAFIRRGEAWGSQWDERFERVLAEDIVAKLKKKNYADGLIDGVASLKTIAGHEPQERAGPQVYLDQFNGSDFADFLRMTSPLPPILATLLGALGVLCFCIIAVDRSNAGVYMQLGAALIGFGMFPYVVGGLIVLVAFMWAAGQGGGGLSSGDGCGGGCGGCSSCGGCGGCG